MRLGFLATSSSLSERGDKTSNRSDLVRFAVTESGESDQESGDVGDGAVVAVCVESPHGRVLEGQREQARVGVFDGQTHWR
jgi:hypothetical protein